MTKLTKEQINEIVWMKSEKYSLNEIAKKFHVHHNTISWHTSEDFRKRLNAYNRERWKKITKDRRKEALEKYRTYQRDYHKKRYNNDPRYREQVREKAKNYQKSRRLNSRVR